MTNSARENRDYILYVAKELEAVYNGEAVNEDGDQMNIYDYLNDVLDVEYILDSSMRLIGCKLYVTLGGPTVWIDTREQSVNIHWGSESDTIYISSDVCDEINEYYAGLFVDFRSIA